MSIGVPVKLLHEAMGHIVTVELKTGVLYRGTLLDAEDNMNVQLKNITVTQRDGKTSVLDQFTLDFLFLRAFT
ncbi:small nuclear ribonucleoprotein Sm D3 [Entophlyctis sp. JEL0112]|nr:small nuclear ribonucleoprotein Sm D3 [Entophlyctis sp. JEL0112]